MKPAEAPSTAALQRRSGNCDLVAHTRRYRGQEFKKRLCAISSRGRNQIATKPSQRFGTHTVECPRGGDERKYASAEERAAKNQKTTVRHFGCTEKVYGLPCTGRTLLLWKRHHRTPSWELTRNIYACDNKSYIDDV